MELTEEQKQIFDGKICPYCKQPSEFVDSSVVYRESYGMIYRCQPCDAYVGVHRGTDKALGRLANAELRALKKAAHAAFDPIWKHHTVSRSAAYKWLSGALGLPPQYTHIGMLNEKSCLKVIELSNEFLCSQI